MKEITSQPTTGAAGRPWWSVRSVLWWVLASACLAPALVWFDPEFRAALVATLLGPIGEAAQRLFSIDLLVVLAGSTGAGLLIGWVLRRLRAPRPLEASPHAA